MSVPLDVAGRPGVDGAPPGRPPAQPGPRRPLVVTGGIAACAAAGTGLAALTTLTAVGWVAAPHAGVGGGLGGVLRTAAALWLAAHHVGFELRGVGPVDMLPLGLVLLPGGLLWWAGRWVVRTGEVARLRHVGYAAVALAVPYALLSGALAVASRSAHVAPSLPQAVVAGFLLAFAAGGLGGARALAPWGRILALLPARPRSLVMGVCGCLAVLTAAGAVLAGGSLAAHLSQARALTAQLSPGTVGGALLLLAELGYLPNAVIWAVAYALGPGFAFGVGTIVAPTGATIGALPVFPLLAALPAGPRTTPPIWLTVGALAVPYLAGVVGGTVTVRVTPTPVVEAAPLWGFTAGAVSGGVVGVLSAFSGGPLGAGRLSAVGPSPWQVGLVAVLSLGVTAAVAAGAVNWFLLRRGARSGRPGPGGDVPSVPASAGLTSLVDERDDAEGHRLFLNPWAEDDDGPQEPPPARN